MAENENLEDDMDDLEHYGDAGDTVDPTNAAAEPEAEPEPEPSPDTSAADLAALRADPDIAAVLAAKRSKRSLRITVGEEAPEETADDEPVVPDAAALNALDNAGLVGTLLDLLPRALRKDIRDAMSPVVADLQKRRKTELSAEVKALSQRYPDLPEYKEAMVALAKQMPDLRPEEAYTLARLRAGKGHPQSAPARRAGVERPTSAVVRQSGKRTAARPGPRGFSDDLREFLDNINFEE
jgi:hypothetical protein